MYSVLYSATEQDPVKDRPTCNWVYIIYQYLCEKVLYGVCTYNMIPWVTKHTNTLTANKLKENCVTERRCIQNFVYSSSFSQWIAQNIITFNLVRLVVRVHSPDFPYQSVYNSLVFSAVESDSNERERGVGVQKGMGGWEGGMERREGIKEGRGRGERGREDGSKEWREEGREREEWRARGEGRREEEGQRERELSNKYI